jgi:deazaflavin-dependent oxidoreductase (nitroreductase family)
MRRTMSLIGISGIVVGAIWFERVRRRGDLPRIVTHRFNPFVMRLGLAGGRRSPWAILEHVGRSSGTVYHTPMSILASATDDHVYVRLSYGADVQWVRNVRTAGHCRIQHHETILELDEPAIVDATENLQIVHPTAGGAARSDPGDRGTGARDRPPRRRADPRLRAGPPQARRRRSAHGPSPAKTRDRGCVLGSRR